MEQVLKIWLNASLKAHDFIPAEFWQSQLSNMREMYLPASEVWVYQKNTEVLGFYALLDHQLAAIFVAPEAQRQGVGKALLNQAKSQRAFLSLCVYQANQASLDFYHSQGFKVVAEQIDQQTNQPEVEMRWP